MNINPNEMHFYYTGIQTVFIKPPDMIFENTVRRGFLGIFKKKRKVNVGWIKIKTNQEEIFEPIFTNEDGYQLPNIKVAENHLEKEILIPDFVTVSRHIHYSGHCCKCGRFHMTDDGEIINIVAMEDQFSEDIMVQQDEEPLQHKCSDPDCNGWYEKRMVVQT